MTGHQSVRDKLEAGLKTLALDAPETVVDGLLSYMEELREWSGTYNLVAAGEGARLLQRHVLDSLSIVHFLQPGALLDIGTGAGLPGLPLAILDPCRPVTLIDSAGKKIRFIRHVGRTLQLTNIEPLQERIENLEKSRVFANITSRAFASLAKFVTAARPAADKKTLLLAMKGNYPHGELEALPDWVSVESVEVLAVPGLHVARHLVMMTLSK